MAYDNGGQICVDKNGAIFVRYGNNILKISAMIPFDDMLVCGTGMTSGDAANLVFFKKLRYQEKGKISAGTAANNTMSSLWTSPTYHLSDYSRSRITRLEVTYYHNHNYQTGTSSGFTITYRRDDEVDTEGQQSDITGSYLPKFTTLKEITLTTTDSNKDRYHTAIYDLELEKEAKIWQFRITSDYDFKVVGMTVWNLKEQLTQD